jgi:tetratricopeptide (TPR) repeat protein
MTYKKSLAVALSLGLLTSFPTLAMADDFETLMLQGIEFYKKGSSDPGNFAKAIEKFEQAKKINPIPDVVYNIARAHHLLGNYEQAYIAYCEYSLTSQSNANSVKTYMDAMKSRLNENVRNTVTCNAALVKSGIPKPSNSSNNKVIRSSELSGSFESLMTKGLEYYKKGSQDPQNYAQAIEYFSAAKKQNPLPDVVYNIARSYHLMGDCENALESYREFAMTSAANANKVKDYISSLSSQCGVKMGSLNLKCEPANAVVSIDNAANVACNGTHSLKAGDHSLLITAEGYEPETRKISVSSNNIPANVSVTMRAFVVNDPEANSTGEIATTEDGMSESSSRVITENADERGGTYKPGSVFWGGVGTAGAGILMMIGGGIAIGNSHRLVTHQTESALYTYYERNSGLFKGGSAVLGIGAAASLIGVSLIIVDVLLNNQSDDEEPQAVRFTPAISFDAESASAGFTMTF